MRNCRFLVAGATLDVAPFITTNARAAVLAQDSFESYAPGQLEDNTGVTPYGGSGFTNAWNVDDAARANAVVVSPGLFYNNGAVTNDGGSQALRIGGTNSNNFVSRTFPATSNTVYFGFLYRTNNDAATSEDFVQIGLSSVATGEPNAASVGTANNITGNAPPPVFFARVPFGSNSNTANTANSLTTLQPNTTYFLIGKASKVNGGTNYNQVDLYLNPDTLTEGTPLATATYGGTNGVSSVSNLIVRTARLETGDQYFLDNVTIGSTYADVVPEPGTLGLAGVAAGAFLLRRRVR